jgi:hypothetical protein
MTATQLLREQSHPNPYFVENKEPLEPLPYPVYFVTKNPKWADVISGDPLPPIEELYNRCAKTNDIWSAQVYLDLKQRGLDVHLVAAPVPGQICVIPYYYLSRHDSLFKSYVVACHHDCAYPELCDERIVINRLRVRCERDHYLIHRPQPNLKPRSLGRGSEIRNVVFNGHVDSLHAPFRAAEFSEALQALGMKLVMNTECQTQFTDWSDCTEVDIVLAVRNSTIYDVSAKPPLKLVNAWFTGCPAILGPEPAYQALRQSELDYIEVRTPEEAIAALKQLQDNPDLYLAMVENGFRRAQAFTLDSVQTEWRNLLAGAIAQGYERWCQQSWLHKSMIRPVEYARRILAHRQEYKIYSRLIHEGERIL